MKTRALAVALGLLLPLEPATAARVVLVGIDGGSWNVLDPLLAKGELPQLQALLDRGVQAELETVEPVNSPTVWTSIATGRSPASHGVNNFFQTRLSIQVRTVFDRLAESGRRVGLYEYLMTWPPPVYAGGFVVPGWLRRDESVFPADLWQRAELEPRFFFAHRLRSPHAFIAAAALELAEKPARFVRLLDVFDIDVAAVTFYSLDALSHRLWHAAYPRDFTRPPPASSAQRRAIPDALRAMDAALGTIAAALRPDDHLIVVSDHGFEADPEGRSIWSLTPSDALARGGLDPKRDGYTPLVEMGPWLARIEPGPRERREKTLRRLVDGIAALRSPGGEPIAWVVARGGSLRSSTQPVPSAAAPAEIDALLGTRLEKLANEESAYAWVAALPRPDVLGSLSLDTGLELANGTIPLALVASRDDFSGRHRPTGIAVALGPGIRHAEARGTLSVLDVGPLLLYLAGAEIPDNLEGAVPEDWLRPAWLVAHPVRRVPARESGPPGPQGPLPEMPPDVRERLRALGYEH